MLLSAVNRASRALRALRAARRSAGFTLVEMLVSLFVVSLIMMAAVSVYTMGWRWWAEVAPRIEAQKVVRVALASIIDGRRDATAGTYVVGSTTYNRRCGIAWSVFTPTIDTPSDAPNPASSRIRFGLNKSTDTATTREFRLKTDPATGLWAVYYKDDAGTYHMIKPTIGITNLQFEKYSGLNNLIKVTATVDKTVQGTRRGNYRVKAEYSEFIYLRSVASI